jgi:hypothetical protein
MEIDVKLWGMVNLLLKLRLSLVMSNIFRIFVKIPNVLLLSFRALSFNERITLRLTQK